ncbi:MAG: hypothetical protein FD130_382 [Halothiobacillaceae bacterium]|nr:MAG: hypothetical protein FD130_382 [Halothiobacillaceae bacterium]
MKKIVLAICLSIIALPALASKPCEELKAEIDTKLQTKGVTHYELTIVAADAVGDGKVVGSCELGKKKIVYKKT